MPLFTVRAADLNDREVSTSTAADPSLDLDADDVIDTVVVTAQKREQPAMEVPMSLDVLKSETLDVLSSAGRDILFLAARSPSLYAESSSGRIFPRFYIRGLGNTDFDLNANQPVALVYDGIFLENPILKGFPVFDLDRIEVLRGPQGTLFGRNTPAGIVKFESARPTPFVEGYLRASYGRFNTVDGEGAISGPIAPDLSARLSFQAQGRDDFVENTFEGGGQEGFEEFREIAGRLQFLYDPDAPWSALFNVHGRALDGGSRLFRANIIRPGEGGLVDGFRRNRAAQDATQVLDVWNAGSSLTLIADLSPAVTLTSISGYETVRVRARGDVDGGFGADFAPPSGPGSIPFAAETADNITGHHQLTQEVRARVRPSSALDATFGAFLFYEDLELENLSFDTLSGGVENGRAIQAQETFAWAIFGSTTWQPWKRLDVTAGLRLSGETKDFTAERLLGPFGAPPLGPVSRELDDLVPTGDLAVLFRLTEDWNLFARYARGFRAPNVQGRIVFGDAVTTAETETIDSVEAGFKSRTFDGRLAIDGTGFLFRTSDQQLTAVGGAGNFNQLLNAENVLGYGFEIDVDAEPIDRLELNAGMSFNHTEIRDDDLQVTTCAAPCTVLDPTDEATGNAFIDGNRLPQAPRWIARGTARYGVPLFEGRDELYAFIDWRYRSSINFFLYESVEFRSDPLFELGARLGYRYDDGFLELAVFGRNVLNATALQGAIDFNNLAGYVNDPALWGFELIGRF